MMISVNIRKRRRLWKSWYLGQTRKCQNIILENEGRGKIEKIDDGEKQGKGNRIEGHIRRKEGRREDEKE